MYRLALLLLTFALSGGFSPSAHATPADDAYIAGYATAVLEREFHLSGSSVHVRDGVVLVNAESVNAANRDQVLAALSRIAGVTRVEVRDAGSFPPPLTATPGLAQAPSPTLSSHLEDKTVGPTFLPSGLLFEPLLADPRWPHFAVTYRYYLDDNRLDHASATDFGETIALYRDSAFFDGQWEVGVQAGVFAIFDLDRDSKDLVNADYTVGLPVSYRLGDFSAQARIFHQSSHLGDEFLLRNLDEVERINLSYESVDLLLSYKFFRALRVYGGGGRLFDEEPSDLQPWTTQYGVEFDSPQAWSYRSVRPVVAAHFHNDEEDNFSTNISIRAGLQFDSWQINRRKLMLLGEYFKGYSPNGQFYTEKIETIGLGLHLHF